MKRALRWLAVGALALALIFAVVVGPPAQVRVLETGVSCRMVDETLGVATYQPRCKGERDIGEGPVPFLINGRGFRGAPPIEGARRVLLLGGSRAFAPGLTNAEEPSAVAEAYLQEHDRAGVDILNLSVEGYSSIQHAIRLPKYLAHYEPDLVVLTTFTRRGIYREHLVEPERNDNGYPLRLLGADPGWLHFTSSWSLRDAGALPFAGPALDSTKNMARLCRSKGVKFRVAWDGRGLSNARSSGAKEGSSALRWLTPRVEVTSDDLEWLIVEKGVPLYYAADWYPDREREPELFTPDGSFATAEGVDRLGFGLARLVDGLMYKD